MKVLGYGSSLILNLKSYNCQVKSFSINDSFKYYSGLFSLRIRDMNNHDSSYSYLPYNNHLESERPLLFVSDYQEGYYE